MKKSKLSILLLFLVMILAISAVSAADTNDTSDSVAQAVDEAPVEEVASADVDAVAATDDTAVLADPGDKNFTQLQAEIDQSNFGMITLNSNYVRQDGESDIVINKNFNIFGNDVYTIDANNKGGIFKINQGCSVLLNNVVLINGNGINGGAIYNEGTVNVISSTLTGNDASNGGAIYSTGIATITGSTINGNTATNGGAIYSTGTLVVSDGNTFNDNVAANRGGAIYSTNVEISNSNFNDNTAGEGAGVYVADGAKLTAEGTTFKHNVASEYDGGAIYTDGGEIALTNCVLDSNDVTKLEAAASENKGGAAIYANNAVVTLTDTDVVNNGRNLNRTNNDMANGVLNLLNSDTTIVGGLFQNNTGIYGGAIYAEGGKIKVSKSSFVANNAYSGGAIQLEGDIEFNIEDSTFTDNNKAVGIGSPGYAASGGAIFVRYASQGSIDNITVDGSYSSQGGAVDIETNSPVTIKNSEFKNNVAENRGGAIFLYNGHINVDNCTFVNNSATDAGAIWAFDNVDISGSEFTDNSASENGGAIYFTKYCTESSVTDSKFTGNTAASGNAMYNNKGTLAFSNNTIDAGANIVNNGTITSSVVAVVTADKPVYRIEEVTLTAILTDDNGNAINDTAFKFVFNTPAGLAAIPATFNGNNYTAKFTPAKDGEYNVTVNYAGDVTNATFTVYRTLTDLADKIAAANGNPVVLDGDYTYNVAYDSAIATAGGIAIASGITIDGKGYTICGNDATRIFNVASGVTLTLNNVTVCHGNASDGAGVYIASGAGLVANDVTFEHNTAVSDGGAIYATGATVELTRCILDANDVTEIKTNDDTGGAAIFANNSALTIRNSKITNNGNKSLNRSNDDLVNGVLNLFNSKTVITDSLFENNTGIYGGAIIAQSLPKDISLSSLTVSGTNFTRNTAYNGGGIYTSYTTLNISDCLFTDNNKATGIGSPGYTSAGGAINVMTGSVATISNITVRGSYSATGAAISTQKSNVVIEKSTFEDNYAFSVSTATGVGGAIFLDGPSIVDNCTFKNNYAETNGGAIRVNDVRGESIIIKNVICDSNGAGNGGAIYLTDFNITVTDSEFINNDATENGGAIAFSNWCTYGCSVNNSNFTGNTAGGEGNAIYGTSASKFSLSNNIVSGSQADIVSAGEIESQINVTTYNAIVHYGGKVNLTATITDDNGNLIDASDFYFVVNNTNYGPAVYNPATGKYEFEQEFNLTLGTYEITMKYDKELTYVEKGNLTAVPKKGTYSDLQAQIDALTSGEVLELTYDFAYDASYDADRFPNGVIITKDLTIKGNDHYIDGNETVRIFASFAKVNLNDIVFKNGKATKGGAIYTTGNLDIDNCTFINNTATKGNDIYVDVAPYQVYLVYDEASYDAAFNGTDSPLYKYYQKNPTEDIDTNDPRGHSWTAAISAPVGSTVPAGKSKFPWIVLNMDEPFTGYITINFNGTDVFGPWGLLTDKVYGIISVPASDDCGMVEYALDKNTGHADKELETDLFEAFFANDDGVISATTNPDKLVSVSDSTFTDNAGGYSIYNLGNLELDGNAISNGVYNEGNITSEYTATVLGNKTINVTATTYELNATLTDGNGNDIYDPNLRFTVNGKEIADQPAYSNGVYTFAYNQFTTDNPSYLIGVNNTNLNSLIIKTGVVVNILRGTFTDLQQRIEASNGDLVLPYDFTYDAEIDGNKFINGITLTKNIVGNGSVIDANGANVNIFVISNGATVKLSNLTITGVNRSENNMYGAVVNHGSLTVENATFKDNNINKVSYANGGAAIFNDGTSLTVIESKFINNTAPWKGSTGAISSWAASGLLIKDSYFEANVARFGGALEIESLNQQSVAVENCTFFNNTGYQGGAFDINDGARYVNVTGCTFDSNSFQGPAGVPTTGANGAAISVGLNVPVTLEISDSIIKNNVGDDSDHSAGVGIRLADYATGIITNCTFENNGKGHSSAINVGTYNGRAGGLTLKDSTFINSIADENIMVFINPNVGASIENCTFENVGANYTIYTMGTLSLSNNTIHAARAIMNVNGTIISEVNATLIGGKEVKAALGETVIANATLTDDNGNVIYDADFNITINAVELKTTFADGIYTAEYTIETAGDNVVSTNYAATNVIPGKYLVDKANVTEFTVSPGGQGNRIPYGENVTVYVGLYGVNDEGLNETFTVIVNNTEYTVTVVNGTGSFNVSGLEPGDYSALAIFDSNPNYNKAYATGVFSVLRPDRTLSIAVENVEFGEIAIVNITINKGEESDIGVVVLNINGTEYTVSVEGNASIEIPGLPVGTHVINATLLADGLDDAVVNDTVNITVADNHEVTVVANANETISYGENLTVEIDKIISSGLEKVVTGNATIYIYDGDDSTVEPVIAFPCNVGEDGVAVDFKGLPVGTYMIIVDFDSADGYYSGQATTYATVTQSTSSIDIISFLIHGEYPGRLVISYEVVNVTEVYVTVTDEHLNIVYNETISGEQGTYDGAFVVEGLSVGTYNVRIDNVETQNYKASTIVLPIKVEKAVPDISVSAEDTLFGLDTTVTVTVSPNATGIVRIIVNGKEYIADIEGTTATATIEAADIVLGENNVNVIFDGDGNYTMNYNSTTFMAYDNVVTNDTFFRYFDKNGILLDTVPFDELIFKGEFADLGITHIFVDNVDITGEDALLNNIGFVINDDVSLSDMTLVADKSIGQLIYVSGDNVVISGMDISYAVGNNESSAIYVYDSENVNIVNNEIVFESHVTTDKEAMAINVLGSSDVVISNNNITASLPAINSNWGLYYSYGMMGISDVHAVKIMKSEDVDFTKNNVITFSNEYVLTAYSPTIESVLIVDSDIVNVDYNNFTVIDEETPIGSPAYLYALTMGIANDAVISNNNFNIATDGGVDAMGSAYAIQFVTSNVDIIGNNITSVSNGPNLGIYVSYSYDEDYMFEEFEVNIINNNIDVTGYAANTTTWNALLTGIEAGVGDVTISENTINVHNKAGYIEGAYVYGISYAQSSFAPSLVIENNDVIVEDGDYAVSVNFDVDTNVTNNYLIAHKLYGDEAVNVKGEAVVKDNFPAKLNLTISVEDIKVGEDAIATITANELFNGEVILTWGIEEIPVTLTDGIGSFSLGKLPANVYNVGVYYDGSSYFPADENTTNFTVSKFASQITIKTSDVVVDQNVGVTIVIPGATGNITLDIDGNIQELALENGVATATIEKIASGEHYITVAYDGDDNLDGNQSTYEFNVSKSSDYLFEAGLPENAVEVYETAYVIVTLPDDASDKIKVYVNGTLTAQADANRTVSIPLNILPSGNYTITVTYADAKYDEKSIELNLTVERASPELYVEVEDITVADVAVIHVYADELFNGTVTVYIGNEAESLKLTDGYANLTLGKLPAENYTVQVKFAGDDLFTADDDEDEFTVSKLETEFIITFDTPVVDEDLTINISLPGVSDKITLIVDGYNNTVTLEDGKGSLTIPKANMTAGDHYFTAIFGGNGDYEPAYEYETFTIEKQEDYPFDVNLTIDEITVGENLTFNVTLPEDANGIVTVTVDDEPVTFENVVNGKATVTISASEFTSGEYNTIEVTYADDKYGETTVEKEIYVNKLVANLTISADNITIGENAVLTVTIPGAPESTYVTVELLGEIYDLFLIGGKDSVSVSGLGEGTYTAYVFIEDDPVYDDATAEVTFSVTKVDIPAEDAFNVTTPENATAPEFKVTLPEDATGYLLLDINGTQTFVPLVNGTATARVPEGFAPGNYSATVTYTGDNKYDPITTTQNITVESNVPDNAFTIPDTAKDGEPLTYAINLPSDAKGYLEVDVDGTKHVAALVNGSASITVPGLSAGNHNVTVSYTGDGKYSPVTKSMAMNVPAPVYKITNNNNVAAIYSANANYKVLITKDGKAVGAGESVNIVFNGKTYTVKTDSKGYATLNLNTKVKVKTYTVTAEYKGVKVSNKVTIKHVIKAKNVSVKKSKKVNKIKVKTNKVNGKFLKGKKLTLKIKGKKIKAKINKKGVATFKVKKSVLKKLKVGKKYKYTVTYGKDKVTKKVKVKR